MDTIEKLDFFADKSVEQINKLGSVDLRKMTDAFISSLSDEGSKSITDYYQYIVIPKRGRRKLDGTASVTGFRSIYMPVPGLKALSRRLLLSIKRPNIDSSALGCRKFTSILDSGYRHMGSDFVIKMDITKFFDNISFKPIRLYLSKNDPSLATSWAVQNYIRNCVNSDYYLGESTARFLVNAVMRPSGVGLFTGSPLAPLFANILMRPVDQQIKFALRSVGKSGEVLRHVSEPIRYSRYVDDLCFSSEYPALYKVVPVVTSILQRVDLEVNVKKTRIMPYYRRQAIVGLVINGQPSVNRRLRYALKSVLHGAIIYKKLNPSGVSGVRCINGKLVPLNPLPNKKGIPDVEHAFSAIKGKVAFIDSVNSVHGDKLKPLLRMAIEAHTLPKENWSLELQAYGRH